MACVIVDAAWISQGKNLFSMQSNMLDYV